jgi:dihydroorotate dehydrogenase (NAD+) catalytic subunit
LRLVAEVAPAVAVPVIGIGGITTAAEAQQFLAVGAQAVGVGTALLNDPRTAGRIAAELQTA